MTNNLYGLVKDCTQDDSTILFWSKSYEEVHQAMLNSRKGVSHLSIVPL